MSKAKDPRSVTGKDRKGQKPNARNLAKQPAKGKQLQANQWQGTPQQLEFMRLWLNPQSSTFGNAYQSGILAGYSEKYANQIATPSLNNKWLTDYKNLVVLTGEHIQQGISEIAKEARDSRSPDDTRLKAYEILAKIQGLLDGATTKITVVQPILGGLSSTPDKVVVPNTTSQEVIEVIPE